MLIKGKKISGPNVEIIVIPRTEEDLIFKAQAVLNINEFEKICPSPEVPTKMLRGGKKVQDFENKNYQAALNQYANMKMCYMILKSLEATDGLVWETVDMSDPNTWKNYSVELMSSGFSDTEIQRLINGVMTANCLNEDKLEQARQDFLAGQAEQKNGSLSQKEEQKNTRSGELVNA